MSLTGQLLGGRYRLEELLGKGSFGAVYAATQVDLGRPVAVKTLNDSAALGADGITRFEREARAAAALGHPNIALVTDFQSNPGEPPFLVMERLAGRTLGSVMKAERRLPTARIAWIAYQVLAALDVAHRAGIIHRDVKADNVFLVSVPGVDDFVKLLDFGVAKLADGGRLTASGTAMGSPTYMAPEQLMGTAFDHRVDLYAVGAMMYCAASGRLPFDAPNLHALIHAVTRTQPMPLTTIDPGIDPAFVAVVTRAMQKDPNARYATAEEMRAALGPLSEKTRHPSEALKLPAGPPLGMPPPTPTYGPPPGAPTYGPPLPALGPTAPGFGPSLPGYGPAVAMPGPSVPPTYGPPPGQPSFGPGAASPPIPVAQPTTSAPNKSKMGAGTIIVLLIFVAGLLVVIAAAVVAFLLRAPEGSKGGPVASASASSSAGARVTAASTAAPSAAATAVAEVDAGAAIVRPVAKPDGGITLADAGPPAGRKQYGGTAPYLGGGTFGPYDDYKTILGRSQGAITACYVANEFEPPDHQFDVFNLTVDPLGRVTSVTPGGTGHPKLFPCVSKVLSAVKWPPHPGGAQLQVRYTARTKDNP